MKITDLQASIQRAAKAGDARATIEQLITLWQETPANAIADSLDKLTKAALPKALPASVEEAIDDVLELPRLLDRLREGNAASAAGQIAKVRAAKDPRVAAAIVRLLEDPPWHATGSKPFWTRLFDLLDANMDLRSIARLQKIDYSKIINGKSMRGWMQGKVDQAIATLEEASLMAAKVSKEERAALEKITVAPPKGAAPAKSGGKASEAALLKAVYDNPDDDAPRAVLADFLIERGDPRGELIALQLGERTPETEKRMLTLLRKNQKAWLGPIAPYVKYIAYPSVNVEDPISINLWWKRGFPTGAILAITKPKLIELADLPIWSTFERLRNVVAAGHPDPDWDKAMLRLIKNLRGLKDLEHTNVPLLKMAKSVPGFLDRIERMSIEVDDDEVDEGAEHIGLLPNLKKLWIHHWESIPKFKPIFDAGFLTTRLEQFELSTSGGEVKLERLETTRALRMTLKPERSELLMPVVKDLASSKAAAAIKAIAFMPANTKQRKEFAALFPKAKVVELSKKKKKTKKKTKTK